MRGFRAGFERTISARPHVGFRGGGWRRTLSTGLSEHWLRTIVIFALIHRPILPLSLDALGAQVAGLCLEGDLLGCAFACDGSHRLRLRIECTSGVVSPAAAG